MKRMLSLILFLSLLCFSYAFGENSDDFDLSVFNLYDYELYTFSDGGAEIDVNNDITRLREYGEIEDIDFENDNYFSSFQAFIYLPAYPKLTGYSDFMLKIGFSSDNQLIVNEMEFLTGITYYKFDIGHTKDDSSDIDSKAYLENVYINIDQSNFDFLEALLDPDNTTTVEVICKNGDHHHFTVPKKAINKIREMFDDFIKANGKTHLRESSSSKMTTSSYLEKLTEGAVTVQTPITNFKSETVENWIENEDDRALLTYLLAYDSFQSQSSYSDLMSIAYNGVSFVGKSKDDKLHIAIQTNNSTYYIIYTLGKSALIKNLSGDNKLSDSAIEQLLRITCEDYYTNDSAALMRAVTKHVEILSDFSAKPTGT